MTSTPDVVEPRRRWSREALLVEIRTRADRGESISSDAGVYSAIRRHFGSLGLAADLAGVRVRRPLRRSREETIAALRELARTHEIITDALVVEHRLRRSVLKHFRTLSAACVAAGVVSTVRRREWLRAVHDAPAQLIEQLRSRTRSLGRPVTRRDLPRKLVDSLVRCFGSIAAARDAANLRRPKRPTKWTQPAIIRAIRREHARGARITEAGLDRAGRSDLAQAIKRKVGSFERARALAHITNPPLDREHPPFSKVWNRERVLAEIRVRHANGLPLAASRIPRPLVAAACRHCGSWRAAIEAAGFTYDEIVLVHRSSEGELLRRVRELAHRAPQLSIAELRRLPLGRRLDERFGGIAAAVGRAGVADWPVRRTYPAMARKQVSAAMRARLREGLPVTRTAVTRDDPRLAYSVTRIHPVWRTALAALRIRVVQ